jgi:hypothetical protein
MGMGRSHEARIDLPGEGGIIAETAAPGDQTKVFESRHRPADIRLASPVAGFRHAGILFDPLTGFPDGFEPASRLVPHAARRSG